MSHFAVAVILPELHPGEHRNGEEAVHNQLLPYIENSDSELQLEFMEFYEDDECDIDERTGKRGYWQNPNAKWDWYKIGGRFMGKLRLKDGSRASWAKIRDIDTSRDEQRYRGACSIWDYKLNGAKMPSDISFYDYIIKPEFYTKRYGDKETFARFKSDFYFRAVVTPDREWHEMGEMLWWGISDEDRDNIVDWLDHYHERFIEPYMDCTLVVVDCHI